MANTLAYYDTATITAVKSFIVQAPGFAKKLSETNTLAYFVSPSVTKKRGFYKVDTCRLFPEKSKTCVSISWYQSY